MNKVILSLGKGSLTEGFNQVRAELWQVQEKKLNVTGSLPPNRKLEQLQRKWQELYRQYYQKFDFFLRLDLLEPDGVEFHEKELQQVSQQLEEQLNRWLKSEFFSEINAQIRSYLNLSEEIQVLITTEDRQARQLPWHLWRFIQDYRKAEVGLCAENSKQLSPTRKTFPSGVVKILGVFGSDSKSDELDLARDQQALAQLPGTQLKVITSGSLTEIATLLREKNWDIFFFAGHSSPQGFNLTQSQQNVAVSDLESALLTSIEKGLQLAIFNACESLELAWELVRLNIPLVFAMREAVPDVVAQKFLERFLQAYTQGNSLYLSVRSAREHLQELEADFPCASWLPVIFQNPTADPLTWQQLRGERLAYLPTALVTSGLVAIFVIGLRFLGLLQPFELIAFDQFLRLRPSEKPDPRLTLVTVTETDVRQLGQYPLSGSVILETLKILAQHQPRVIGIDIYRDLAVEPGHKALVTYLQKARNVVTVCKVGEPENQDPNRLEVPPIPGALTSFSDLLVDRDRTLRRHLFYLTPQPQSRCDASYAFSAELAFRYLEQSEKIIPQATKGNLKLNGVIFEPLKAHSGFYQQIDDRGHQILLNYRNSEMVAQELTLIQVLKRDFKPSWLKGSAVLIGMTTPNAVDRFATPYSRKAAQEFPGVVIHAQMVSQIIDIATKKRPLLHFPAQWADNLLIFVFAQIGGLLALLLSSPYLRSLSISLAIVLLGCLNYGFLLLGICLPLIPSVLVLVLSEKLGLLIRRGLKLAKRENFPSLLNFYRKL